MTFSPDPTLPPTALGRLAWAASLLFHPFVIAVPTLVLAGTVGGVPFGVALRWGLLAVPLVLLPLLGYLLWQVRRGRYSDFDVSRREQRLSAYLAMGASLLFFAGAFFLLDAPRPMQATLASSGLALVPALLINQLWTKISGHALAIAGSCAVLLRLAPAIGLAAAGVVLLVAWSRVRLGHHTPLQVALGGLVPFLLVPPVFAWFGL